jgi:helix-turn-helix protein
MNQLALEYEPSHAVLPKVGTQHRMLLDAFSRKERLTVLSAIQKYGVYALSQRCGELKRMGWPIKSRTLQSNGKSFSEYWIDFQ